MSDVEGSLFLPANSFNNSEIKNSKMQEEIWKDIEGCEGLYLVSDLGMVKSMERILIRRDGSKLPIKGRILRGRIGANGYPFVTLCNNGKVHKYIHRIVLTAFVPNTENKRTVNHKNGVRHDNRVENLEWATDSENGKHSFAELGRKPTRHFVGKFGKDHVSSKPVIQLTKLGEFVSEYDSGISAGIKTGINRSGISACCLGKLKLSGGFNWEFKTL